MKLKDGLRLGAKFLKQQIDGGVRRARGEERRAMLSVGDRAPSFSVQDHRGLKVTEKDLSGYTLLWFYPKADTPG